MICAAVIPCFNEEKTIARLIAPLQLSASVVIVVDDGSSDKTALEAQAAGATVLRHQQNLGKGAALQTGLSHALNLGFEWAATLDGDGQHDPAELPSFLHCAEQNGSSLIIGNRMGHAQAMPWVRRQVNRWMSQKLSRFAGHHLPDTQSGFRLVRLPAWAALPLAAQHFEIESEMLLAFLAANHSVEFVPIRVICSGRKSRIHPLKDTLRWCQWWAKVKRMSAHAPGFPPRPSPPSLIVRRYSP